MKNLLSKNKFAFLALTTVVATTVAFAQNANVNTSASINVGAPVQGGPGMMGRVRDMRQDFREEMHDKMDWRNGSGTPGSATPTPWKDLRGNMQNLRADMQGMMASITANLTDAQKTAIAAKLGITVSALQAEIASGTPLREIIGNKISREDMMQIIQPMMASGTMQSEMHMMTQPRPRGFLNSLLGKIFGNDDDNNHMMPPQDGDGNMMYGNGSANVNASADVDTDGPVGGIKNFFKNLFHF